MRQASLADIESLAELMNGPAIRPTLGGEGVLDPTALISDARNVCLFNEAGGAMFAWRGPGIYEGHSFFRVRGREAIRQGRGILSLMFGTYGAKLIWGLTPEGNMAARWFNRQLGFKSLGMMDTPDQGACELFSLEGPCL